MTKKFFSTFIALAMFVGLFGVLHYANAQDTDTSATSTTIGNVSPVITTPPSDGGSHSGAGTASTDGNPTQSDYEVNFTATALDVNDDQYYLAICTSEAVTAGTDAAPTCADTAHTWVISSSPADSEASATADYSIGGNSTAEALCTSNETCAWHAFVCDKVASGAACFPASDASDQGYAVGTVTFADVPVDQAVLTIDGETYEFDNGGSCNTGPSACINTATLEDGAETATALDTAYLSSASTADARGAVVYIYATDKGAAGNGLGVSETNDTGNDMVPVDTAGGDTENASPFYINHKPTFGTVTIDASDGSTIAPGDTVRFTIPSAQLADDDTEGGQDTINMYVCSGQADQGGVTSAFNYTANTCTGGTLLCSHTGVNPATTDATCNDTTDIVSVPTAHATDYTVMIYVEDNHSEPSSSGTHSNDYSVIDVAPVLNQYITSDSLTIAAGGSDVLTYTMSMTDDNGDLDVTDYETVFFEDTSVDNDCSADDNDCIIENIAGHCSFTGQGSAGSGKTATGSDNALGATCDFTVYFNATASTSWEVQGKPTDGLGQVTSFNDSSDNNIVGSLQGVDVTQAAIAYGTVAIGGTSVKQETSMGNVGNQVLDMFISGDTMCTDYPTCSGTSINLVQQKFAQTGAAFDWNDAETDPGPWILDATGSGTDEATGCINRDIAVRNDNAATTTNESIWWKIRIPAGQAAGSYTGQNTFTTTASTTCSGGALN